MQQNSRKSLKPWAPQSAVEVVLAMATLLAVPPFVSYTYDNLAAHRYSIISGLAIFLTVLIYIAGRRLIRRRRKRIVKLKYFFPFATFKKRPKTFIPRTKEEDELQVFLERVRNEVKLSGGKPVAYIVGESGVGKSSLIASIKKKGNWPLNKPLTTGTLLTSINDEADRTHPAGEMIFIVDQLERFIGKAGAPALKKSLTKLRASLTTLFANVPDSLVLFVIRPEWHWYLGRLGKKFAPSRQNTFVLEGFDLQEGREMKDIKGRFKKIGVKRGVEKAVRKELSVAGRISPVQLGIVGATIEAEVKSQRRKSGEQRDRQWYEQTIGSTTKAMAKYRDRLVGESPNKRVTAKILLALSTRTRFRVTQSLSVLQYRLFENESTINECIKYLVKKRVVRKEDVNGEKELELSHDFIAALVQGMSSDAVTPRERDNVLFNFEPNRVLSKILNEERSRRLWVGIFGPFELACLVIGLSIALTRAFAFRWFPHIWMAPQYLPVKAAIFPEIDLAYLPIGVVNIAWLYYLITIYARLFGRLDEGRWGKFFSWAFMAVGIGCMFVAALCPITWVLGVGFIGLVFGIKLVSLGLNPRVSAASSRKEIRGIGGRTVLNLSAISLAGLAAMLAWTGSLTAPNGIADFATQSAAIASAFLLGVILLMPVHASPAATSELLGLLARSDEIGAVSGL